MRWRVYTGTALIVAASLCSAAEPESGLTCEQLFAASEAAVRYRDEGYSLAQVLGALKGVQAEGKLTAAELETLRRAVTLAYLGNATPKEIAFECVQARDARKPWSFF